MLFFKIFSKAESGMSFSGPKNGFDAALQTRTSIDLYVFKVKRTRSSKLDFSDMLAAVAVASQPKDRISSTTFSHASIFLLDTTTLAP